MRRIKNQQARERWIAQTLRALPADGSLLDVGAGECAHKKYCDHLDYVAQDIAEYDGVGDGAGLQTGAWDTSRLDFICDLYDIPEDRRYDTVFCSEVLEHVVDPVRALEKLTRLTRPGGRVIVTAPFNSLTHFAPYHYCTGFSQYFYKVHFERLGFEIVEMTANGGYFDMMDQELGRVGKVRRRFGVWVPEPVTFLLSQITRLNMRLLAAMDGGRMARRSRELQCMGWFVIARSREGAGDDASPSGQAHDGG
ncbi:methyltransferase domain-containing protein [Roseovarius salis]|uniref:class I SAM-dependent methyltransferase n=1 Tax=Roseovarius salis TaxID=3376063 RepID=UPI0037C7690A